MGRLHFGWSLLDFGPHLPRGVMVAQETLDLFVLVRVQARQPARKRPVAPRDISRAESIHIEQNLFARSTLQRVKLGARQLGQFGDVARMKTKPWAKHLLFQIQMKVWR